MQLQVLIEQIQGGYWLGAAVVVAYALFANGKAIVKFVDWHRSRRLNLLRDASENEHLDAATQAILKEEQAVVTLERVAGVRLDKRMRMLAVKLSEESDGLVPLSGLLSAGRFLRADSDQVEIAIPKLEKFDHYFTLFVSGFLLFSAATFLLSWMWLRNPNVANVSATIGLSFVFGACGFALLLQRQAYFAARRIEKQVKAFRSRETRE